MTAVLNLGKFSWTTCNDPDCRKNLKHVKERRKVALAVVGPDAQAPPWRLPVCSYSLIVTKIALIVL